MACPKCESEMRSYERNGVTFYESDERSGGHRQQDDHRKHDQKSRKSKKKGFLENLMELGGE